MVNVPYLGDPSRVEVFPEAAAAMYTLREAGFWLFVVSNQSGVGRGLITRSQVFSVDAEMKRQLDGDYIHAFYHSFSPPEDPKATDRKPSPALLFKAAEINDLDLPNSFFIGDRLSDIECGLNAGCRSVLLTHEKSSRRENPSEEDALAREKAHYIAANLLEAAQWILEVTSTTATPKTHELE